MRTGRLKTPATLQGENGASIAELLIGITDADDNIPFSVGLLSEARITLRARWHSGIATGRYLRTDAGRLFVINGAADPDNRKQDLLISARELLGIPAEIQRNSGPLAVRVALLEYVTKPARDALLPAEQRRRAEFCNMEYRPQPGHEFTANGSRWRVTEIDTDGTTPVVTRVWVQFLNHE